MTDSYNKCSQEQYFAQLIERINQSDGYTKISHITLTHVSLGCAEGELKTVPDVLNPLGMVHGGCLAALADTVTGAAAHSIGQLCVTLNCSMNYLKPAKGGTIFCRARVQKSGRTIQVCEAVLTDDRGETVATGTFTFYAIKRAE